ncbi:hypothetical protein [Micromonospora siamensis]|uniref:Uncharacterized protein n=1 Tax=Micromonospora siamensis TaxID=299152 RepID=A0A1C5IX19_9ACTN|nr:hypothetical protein [Micromonospora siamensis]SCG62336.1 hypothetical protein GA0074704_3855 [Micromonospora siamensis]
MKTTGWLRSLLTMGRRNRPEGPADAEPYAPELMSLLELARLVAGRRYSERVASAYVEVVTFASADEIVAMLKVMLEEDWMGLPPWARNLAFRLACLQRPSDVELLRIAATDLHAFGPDWDDIAAEMQRRADRMEAGQESNLS